MKRPTFRLEESKHRKLMSKLSLEGFTLQDFGEYCVEQYLSDKLKIKKEVINMEREEMIKEMEGNYIDLDYEWLKENDPEQINWVCKSDYWNRESKKNKLWLRLHFLDNGVGYIATDADEIDVNQCLNNQPYWGEDEWGDWSTEMIEKYYKEWIK